MQLLPWPHHAAKGTAQKRHDFIGDRGGACDNNTDTPPQGLLHTAKHQIVPHGVASHYTPARQEVGGEGGYTMVIGGENKMEDSNAEVDESHKQHTHMQRCN